MENRGEQSNAQNIIDSPIRKTIKLGLEISSGLFYKAREPNYDREYFHKSKKEMTCELSGEAATCQTYSHRKSKKHIAKRQELERTQTAQ